MTRSTAESAKLTGKASSYTPQIAEEILTRLADGETLRRICRDAHLPSDRTVRDWVRADLNGFAAAYRAARDLCLETWADMIVECAFDSSGDFLGTSEKTGAPLWDHENINRSRLKVDSLKWLLSKLKPERYGDKVALTGANDGPLQVEEVTRMSATERSQRILAIFAEAQAIRTKEGGNGHLIAQG